MCMLSQQKQCTTAARTDNKPAAGDSCQLAAGPSLQPGHSAHDHSAASGLTPVKCRWQPAASGPLWPPAAAAAWSSQTQTAAAPSCTIANKVQVTFISDSYCCLHPGPQQVKLTSNTKACCNSYHSKYTLLQFISFPFISFPFILLHFISVSNAAPPACATASQGMSELFL